MAFDLLIRSGTVVDGTGAPPRTADVAVAGGRIVEVGRVSGAAKRTLDADGLTVTPGFVDIHTHYDGQVTWDPEVTPSTWHGVTTVVMGNCGVGFAPVRPGAHEYLIKLMEGSRTSRAPRSPRASRGRGRAFPSTWTPSTPRPVPSTSLLRCPMRRCAPT